MRIVILGAGYAGLTVTRRLERTLPDDVDLLLVNDTESHLVRHELHRLIRRPELDEMLHVSLADVLERAEIRQATVTDVDIDEKSITLENQEHVSYDIAAVCLGSATAYYGLDEVEDVAIPLQSPEDARSIRTAAMTAIGGDVVVGGGGLTGIQAAGELAELSAESDLDLSITLVEMADEIAPSFDATFAAATRRELERRDVTIAAGREISAADESSITLDDGTTLPADFMVWAGGIRGSEALGGERVPTGADLRVGPGTYVLGDAADVTDDAGNAVPASAQTAIREARIVARNIQNTVSRNDASASDADSAVAEPGEVSDGSESTATETYTYNSPGWVVSVGDGAVARVGPFVLSGEPAKAAKAAIGAGHLGSVGAIGKASTLVAEELGWPTEGALALPTAVGRKHAHRIQTDPATPSEIEYALANVPVMMPGNITDDTIDLTKWTAELDSTNPESALSGVRTGVQSALDFATHLGPFGDKGENREDIAIDVDDAPSDG